MPRPKKPATERKVQIATYIPVALRDRLTAYIDSSGRSITWVVERAIREYLKGKKTQ